MSDISFNNTYMNHYEKKMFWIYVRGSFRFETSSGIFYEKAECKKVTNTHVSTMLYSYVIY